MRTKTKTPLILQDGSYALVGDIIRWNVWDNEDYVMYSFLGMVLYGGVMYLGGGTDHGYAIGVVSTFGEVIQESNNNDKSERGILKVGVVRELESLLSTFGYTN